jgi:hypothetical protein
MTDNDQTTRIDLVDDAREVVNRVLADLAAFRENILRRQLDLDAIRVRLARAVVDLDDMQPPTEEP